MSDRNTSQSISVLVRRSDLERWATAMPVLANLLVRAVPRSRSSDIAREHHAEMLEALRG